MNFKSTIGLEVHFELKTKSKIFSPSPVTYGAEPNSEANVIDWGYPGVLPKLNKEVYRLGLMVALATHSEITPVTHFDRKNYYYPDNPKAYQITQFFEPLARNGYVEIEVRGKKKRIGIHEMHIEEDAGKNTHGTNGFSYVDLNRQGVPLLEVVSEPDMEDPEEAYAYLEKLRKIVQFTGASDVKMEEGSMRVDTNISIRPAGQKELGTKVEMKNLNSFEHVRLSLAYEEKRQQEVLLSGGKVQLSTRRFDENSGKTVLERVKEGNADYRYFPEPDIAPYHIKQDWIDEIKAVLPKSAEERRTDYINKLGLKPYDADVILQTKEASDFFDKAMEAGADPQMTANWMNTQVNGYLNEHHVELKDIKLTPENLAKMVTLIKDGVISSKIAKKVFAETVANGTDPKKFVEENGMAQLSDLSVLEPMVKEIVDNNPQSVEDFKNGKDRAIGFLVGQIMKQTHGKANPKIINQLLNKELQSR
ncbi:Asp-tRNA(Asn)/Glu-tRNA(Gln) amidotransferase subunit GatB [Lactobacillus mulieris]|jgi:aspartyl/glutamyl-tRNA(asn/gln) amidotransferase, B subunit|uniref:Aspartyl/glutamyl-tRNA(Asn/Gln) amidotransferase subunit B n=1 Tax=Lactobacillus mulieris TaxID=2508708 RepID=A0AAP3M470_9LACO|nr:MULTISPECIES: Asp-tRNA(Asn)/Glu-tRNA(Gln) amidotransferase subunit GatB [Lactobacillus]EEU20495.1 aspartyl/glutamyl-tRNA(Asn/Gln) amidotransferase subunit B [Lactobacillus jensenii 27-2-CHN]EEX23436.1 aspartyl/glutamyl-tRNA(Asn/Gln) amidotransferase, B subunit [Lactobacillus jensenii 115-3-CHN]EFH30450.1 aspartyl/glutamyl-tRNA(Asn/Gln) amidotransferase, B subunit [Lactobacillus jensenii JV-V16]KAA9243787.1 Asp-tRNA(Asn)/Glu-tRNA(Gln) amidotransferase subunit GatB [Lactobacillus jensenii]KAA